MPKLDTEMTPKERLWDWLKCAVFMVVCSAMFVLFMLWAESSGEPVPMPCIIALIYHYCGKWAIAGLFWALAILMVIKAVVRYRADLAAEQIDGE